MSGPVAPAARTRLARTARSRRCLFTAAGAIRYDDELREVMRETHMAGVTLEDIAAILRLELACYVTRERVRQLVAR